MSDFNPANWCRGNQAAIMALHSRDKPTEIFTKQCTKCKYWYKSCTFSEPDKDKPMCRWCQDDISKTEVPFEIHQHVHCNVTEDRCGQHPFTLTIPEEEGPQPEKGRRSPGHMPPLPSFTIKEEKSKKGEKAVDKDKGN